MVNPIGYRFRPTDLEIVEDYLRPKNDGKSDTSQLDEVIGTINICSFDPTELPSQSMNNKSERDQIWYFYGEKDNKYKRGDRQSRKTKSGFWKITGKPKEIKRNKKKIGEKKYLGFYFNGSKTNWVMHEYHATSPNQMMTYTICKVKRKGEESEVSPLPSSGGEIEKSQSLAEQETQLEDEMFCGSLDDLTSYDLESYINGVADEQRIEQNPSLITDINNNSGVLNTGSEGVTFESIHSQELENPRQFSGLVDVIEENQLENVVKRAFDNSNDEWKSMLSEDEQRLIVSMQQDCSDYRPKPPLTGVFIGHSSDDSDSDSISATTGSIQTLSTCNSFGSSNHGIDQITDLQESPNSTIELSQKVSQTPGQGTEIGEQKMGQEIIKKKRGGFFYRTMKRFVKKISLCSSIPRT